MRVAIVAESFLPETNGVSGSVVRVLEHLERRGHRAMVIAAATGAPETVHGAPVVGLPSVGVPGYHQLRVCLVRQRRMAELFADFRPDIVHLASPLVLGRTGARAAADLGLPTVAVFQTDVAGFARHYGVPGTGQRMWTRLEEIHGLADLTLAPSRYATDLLTAHGIPRIAPWGRGVDRSQFHPGRRDADLHRTLGDGQVLVGYAGRLAAEKELHQLAAATPPGSRLVVIGDGPERAALQRLLPDAVFTGRLSGAELARHVATLDVFVHPGRHETFCQGVQEALACGVPAVVAAGGGVQELVSSSRTGWCYRPGDAGELRRAVADLVGDDAKRRAFGRAAAASVAGRSWARLGDELLAHYEYARTRLPIG
ncbi:glycosyltransferase [Nakamurella sp. YIM 132087]|uniref:Glycosyltransferase n=1 Tax=Nakamurella alba TaxID=2665158 RepID=A0A7K1FPP4_9ACTN|nr:glycosyltransferase family 1 protein [Nakamurella alba]MTD16118.1 glycosyltransferase [Nakamurella alba]